MSSYLTGGSRAAYRLETLNLDCIKSPSASWTSNSSSPSSTLSESTNSQLAIATRKPRTPRKRPNQTYNEAAAILSTAYPKIFPTKHLTKPRSKLKRSQEDKQDNNSKSPYSSESSALLGMPFEAIDNLDFLINLPDLERPHFRKGFNPFEKSCLSPGEINSQVGQSSSEICGEQRHQEDFDAESMLDEEIGEGIDSIMGNTCMETETNDDSNTYDSTIQVGNFVYGYPVGLGLGFDYGYGTRRDFRAIRSVDEGDWWRFPCVNMVDLNPNMNRVTTTKDIVVKKKTKKKKVENKKSISELIAKECSSSDSKAKALKNENYSSASEKRGEGDEVVPQLPNSKLMLKLDHDDVLNTWADKASPFPSEEFAGDVQARLAQIDLFSENGGIREACVLRYKEKRRTRLFSKKIRYQVRKVNADRRPRMKGRFVRTPNSTEE